MGRWLRRILIGGVVLVALVAAAGWALWPSSPTLVVAPESPPKVVLLRGVHVVDVVAGTRSAPQDVTVRSGKIAAIEAHDAARAAPPGAQVIEAKGQTLVPGLVDSHCHVMNTPAPPWAGGLPDPAHNLERLLFSGVTTAFDPGGMAPDIFELRTRVQRGDLLGPRLYAAGPIFTAHGGHPAPMVARTVPGPIAAYVTERMTRFVGSPDEARTKVEALLKLGPDFVKLAIDRIPLEEPRLSRELATAVVTAAKAGGVRTVAHIGTATDALDAARAGAAAWVHGVYKAPLTEEEVRGIAAAGIPMVPTMVVFDSWAIMGRGDYPITPLERQSVPAELLQARIQRPEDFEVDDETLAFLDLLATQRQAKIDNVGKLHRAGVTLLAGSDAQPGVPQGPGLHRELQLLARAGLTPTEILRSATVLPARFLTGVEDPPYGTVAVGKAADLVIVRGNPLESVDALADIAHVIRAGQVLERRPLVP